MAASLSHSLPGNQWSFAHTYTQTHAHSEINAHIKFETYLEFLISSRARERGSGGEEQREFWVEPPFGVVDCAGVKRSCQSCHRCRRFFSDFHFASLSLFVLHMLPIRKAAQLTSCIAFDSLWWLCGLIAHCVLRLPLTVFFFCLRLASTSSSSAL